MPFHSQLSCFVLLILTLRTYAITSYLNEEICMLTTKQDYSSFIKLNSTKRSISQTACVQNFELNTNTTDYQNKYILIQITINSFISQAGFIPIFLERDGMKPIIPLEFRYRDRRLFYDAYDKNGYLNAKTYLSIVLDPHLHDYSVMSYFALYKGYLDGEVDTSKTPLNYDIDIITSDDYLCPQNCNGPTNGYCLTDQRICICNKGFFDLDCSMRATQIESSVVRSKNVNIDAWKYFYYPIADTNTDLNFIFKKVGGQTNLCFFFESAYEYTLTNTEIKSQCFTFSKGLNHMDVTVTKDHFDEYSGGNLLVGVIGSSSSPDFISVQIGNDGSSSKSYVLYIIIAVVGTAVVILGIFIICRCKTARQEARRHANLQAQAAEASNILMLSKEEIEQYFPEKNFPQHETPFPQASCSICLEDFHENASCRLLYCGHIYHGPCISSWLERHHNCPNCKKEMTRAAIEEHRKLKNRNNKRLLSRNKKDLKKTSSLIVHPMPENRVADQEHMSIIVNNQIQEEGEYIETEIIQTESNLINPLENEQVYISRRQNRYEQPCQEDHLLTDRNTGSLETGQTENEQREGNNDVIQLTEEIFGDTYLIDNSPDLKDPNHISLDKEDQQRSDDMKVEMF